MKTTEEMRLLTIHKENFISVVASKAKEVVDKYTEVFDNKLGKLPEIVHLEMDRNYKLQ